VSVECIERGELLAEVRSLYNNLLGRIPRQIRSLHDEVLAQRALDRRLTEELIRFKSRVSQLTEELEVVKDHDSEVTRQAGLTQQELKLALAEAMKNSNLLVEYRCLYELQRVRLENQVEALMDESRMWCGSCYSLANKVIDEHCVISVRQLCITEKSWASLAVHFTVMLSERDTKELSVLRSHVNSWKEMFDTFYATFRAREESIRKLLDTVINDLQKCHNSLTVSMEKKDQTLMSPGKNHLTVVISNMKDCEETLSQVIDEYSGESVLSGQDSLKSLKVQVAKWTNCAITVFHRHRTEEVIHPCHTLMLSINQQVESLINQFRSKIIGDNGVVDGASIVWNNLEDWQIRLGAAFRDPDEFVPLPLWIQLSEQLLSWINILKQTLSSLNSSFSITSEPDNSSDNDVTPLGILGVTKNVQKWLASTTLSMDSEDAKLTNQVCMPALKFVRFVDNH